MWTEMVAAELPVTVSARPRSGRGFRWGAWQRGEPRTACRRPPPLYVALRDRGPSTILWLGAPDQGADQGSVGPLGPHGRDQPNILPLDLNFTFNLILSSLFVSSHIGT